MELPANNFKRSLMGRRQQVGLWVSLASAYSAELVAGSGFDWLLIDTEHSPNEVDNTMAQLQAVAAAPVSAVVRPAWNDKVLIKRHLDIGAQTLLVPYVQTQEEAQAAVSATRFPPLGVRGVAGMTRATRFGRVADYARRAHDEICVLVQVETKLGLDNLEAIARCEGIDGVFIGPADLAAGLGHPGEQQHPEVQAAIRDALARIGKCGKASGILATDEPSARRYMEWGTIFTAVGLDAMILARETERLAARFKSA